MIRRSVFAPPSPVIPTGAAARPRSGGIPAPDSGVCFSDRAGIPPLPSTGSGQAPAVGRDDGWGMGRRVRELRVSGNVMIRCEGLSVRSAALPSGIDRLFYIIRFFLHRPYRPKPHGRTELPKTAAGAARRSRNFVHIMFLYGRQALLLRHLRSGSGSGCLCERGRAGAAVTVETVIKCHDSSWRRSCHLQQILEFPNIGK